MIHVDTLALRVVQACLQTCSTGSRPALPEVKLAYTENNT